MIFPGIGLQTTSLLGSLFSSKVTIEAFKDEKCTSSVGEMELQINPESIVHDHEITIYDDDNPDFKAYNIEGAIGGEPKFAGIKMESIRFDFYLDATGVISGCDSVSDSINDFKELAYKYNGAIHGPNYLKLSWGSLFNNMDGRQFKCRLDRLDINYLLFKPDGTPLRARLDCVFKQHMTQEEMTKMASNQSPDMTHIITVKAGDRLPLLCKDVYGSTRYYLEVARLNNLSTVNYLKPGMQLTFPPLEK